MQFFTKLVLEEKFPHLSVALDEIFAVITLMLDLKNLKYAVPCLEHLYSECTPNEIALSKEIKPIVDNLNDLVRSKLHLKRHPSIIVLWVQYNCCTFAINNLDRVVCQLREDYQFESDRQCRHVILKAFVDTDILERMGYRCALVLDQLIKVIVSCLASGETDNVEKEFGKQLAMNLLNLFTSIRGCIRKIIRGELRRECNDNGEEIQLDKVICDLLDY
ncbi:hypothetical protein GJ496_012023 [Pomphorhynchus laevis]|nr:hypothetical protein GJ496_004551 [Pomphorhynchus laevis]KAI0987258.1 hypothetical protein GJ496_012023 [Pomphorhynchus laevis]